MVKVILVGFFLLATTAQAAGEPIRDPEKIREMKARYAAAAAPALLSERPADGRLTLSCIAYQTRPWRVRQRGLLHDRLSLVFKGDGDILSVGVHREKTKGRGRGSYTVENVDWEDVTRYPNELEAPYFGDRWYSLEYVSIRQESSGNYLVLFNSLYGMKAKKDTPVLMLDCAR
jgi:hypothetical protein